MGKLKLLNSLNQLRYFSIPARGLEGRKKEKEVISGILSYVAPLFNERCSYNAIIEFVTIRKLTG
jgi:hypothetical protein